MVNVCNAAFCYYYCLPVSVPCYKQWNRRSAANSEFVDSGLSKTNRDKDSDILQYCNAVSLKGLYKIRKTWLFSSGNSVRTQLSIGCVQYCSPVPFILIESSVCNTRHNPWKVWCRKKLCYPVQLF